MTVKVKGKGRLLGTAALHNLRSGSWLA